MITKDLTSVSSVPERKENLGRSIKILKEVKSKNFPKFGKRHKTTDSKR